MKIEVAVISKEIIKPSSPTPQSLRNYQLSYLDQLAPPLFMPTIYFYPADGTVSNFERLNRLKISLPKALTLFYPLAGKLVGSLYVDCNDAGVEFLEAKANVGLPEILLNPIPDEMNKFLPYDPDEFRDFCMAVQVSFLSCGGMVIGLIITHKIGDATSLHNFPERWAAIARGEVDIPRPKFKSATFFPPKNGVEEFKPVTKDIVTKIFVFPASKIDALKARYANKNQRPSRAEALSTLIWSRFVASTNQAKAKPNKFYAAIDTAVNLRPIFDPPLSKDYFGNYFRPATAILSMDKDQNEKGSFGFMDKIREAKRNVMNGDYLAKLRDGYSPESVDIKDEQLLVRLIFTSLCGFPIYGVDFGWGRPIWLAYASYGIKNVVTFFDTPSGNGIEAWINLKREDMAKFEADEELRAYLSPSGL